MVVGIDGGGTTTRAICADLNGRVLGHVTRAGTNPAHNARARENVRGAIENVLEQAGRRPSDVASLVAGLSGLDRAEDRIWAEEFVAVEGIDAPRIVLNDAQVAHAGALRGEPGIVAVIGTGAMIWSVNEAGRDFRDFDFGFYSRTASRYLGLDSVHAILRDQIGPEDEAFKRKVLRHIGVTDVDALRDWASRYAREPHEEMKRTYGALAPLVTQAALEGTPLPLAICEHGTRKIAQAFGLLGGCFADSPVRISVVGSVGRSPFFRQRLPTKTDALFNGRFRFLEPDLSPLAGAALLALTHLGIPAAGVADELRKHPACTISDGES